MNCDFISLLIIHKSEILDLIVLSVGEIMHFRWHSQAVFRLICSFFKKNILRLSSQVKSTVLIRDKIRKNFFKEVTHGS